MPSLWLDPTKLRPRLFQKNSLFESQVRAIYAAANPRSSDPRFHRRAFDECAGKEDQLLDKLRAVYKLESESVKE